MKTTFAPLWCDKHTLKNVLAYVLAIAFSKYKNARDQEFCNQRVELSPSSRMEDLGIPAGRLIVKYTLNHGAMTPEIFL